MIYWLEEGIPVSAGLHCYKFYQNIFKTYHAWCINEIEEKNGPLAPICLVLGHYDFSQNDSSQNEFSPIYYLLGQTKADFS